MLWHDTVTTAGPFLVLYRTTVFTKEPLKISFFRGVEGTDVAVHCILSVGPLANHTNTRGTPRKEHNDQIRENNSWESTLLA